jgi:thiol-disulfide isomerase/thioredoxin
LFILKCDFLEKELFGMRKNRFADGFVAAVGFLGLGWGATPLVADSPTAEQALRLKPRQANVQIDKVEAAEVGACELKQVKRPEGEGFLVTGPTGETLRWFVDTNGDKELDRWCYFAGGVEVYRDIDSDFDKTADQFRWLGTAGIRWGIDENADGKIDSWKAISAEEVTQELVEAVKTKDSQRFAALLLADKELEELGLGSEKTKSLKDRLASAIKLFEEYCEAQKLLTAESKWAHFGADKPGLIPAGTEDSTQDIVVYENVVAMTDTKGSTATGGDQLLVGTLVQVGNSWRLIDAPRSVVEGAVLTEQGLFFNSTGGLAAARMNDRGSSADSAMKEAEKLMDQLETVEKQLREATSDEDKLRRQEERADVLEKLISEAAKPEDRDLWIRQFADTVSAAIQAGEYPKGLERLSQLPEKLKELDLSNKQAAYVAYRVITADYALKVQKPDAKFDEIQTEYLAKLEEFVGKYSDADDAAEGIVTIAMSREFEGKGEQAMQWYQKASSGFPDQLWGQKATGALTRLKLEGKKFPAITGVDLDGKKVDLGTISDRPIVLHFWASWCEPCKADMKVLRELQSRLAKQKIAVVGVNLDNDPKAAAAFVKANKYTWPHLQTKNGLDSQIAVQLGILTLPVTIVVDSSGKVIKSNAHSTEIEKLLVK